MTRRYVPVHETVERTLFDALGVPGLAHLATKVALCEAEGKISAHIDFLGGGHSVGVVLNVCADDSFILMEKIRGQWTTIKNWSSEEAEPDLITAAVVEALRRRIADPVAA